MRLRILVACVLFACQKGQNDSEDRASRPPRSSSTPSAASVAAPTNDSGTAAEPTFDTPGKRLWWRNLPQNIAQARRDLDAGVDAERACIALLSTQTSLGAETDPRVREALKGTAFCNAAVTKKWLGEAEKARAAGDRKAATTACFAAMVELRRVASNGSNDTEVAALRARLGKSCPDDAKNYDDGQRDAG